MQWLRLHRNSKAKSHGSCCWHAEEAFLLASSLLSTSFAEAAQTTRLWGCPWLLASTCTLAPGQEVTDGKRLDKAAPSRANIFLTVSFCCRESSGVTSQCICLLSSHQWAPPSARPVLLPWQLYQFVYFVLIITLSVVMVKAMDAGGGYLLKPSLLFANPSVFPRHVSLQLPSQQAYIKFAAVGFDILCSQHATTWLRTLLSLLESRRIAFHFVLYSRSSGNKCYCSGLDHLHVPASFLWKLPRCPIKTEGFRNPVK